MQQATIFLTNMN